MDSLLLVNVEEFLDGFDESEHSRLDDGRSSWRKVYAMNEFYQDELDFEDPLVVKYSDSSNARSQNRTEMTSFLESIEREQEFIPRVVAGSSDFEYLVALRINPLPEPQTGHPWRENPELEQRTKRRNNTLPEGWCDNDDIELGVYNGDVKLMDAGTLIRSDWIVGDPLQHETVDLNEYNGREYFTLD